MRKILTLLLMSLLTCVNALAVGEDFVKDCIRYIIFVSGDDVGDDGISACVEPIDGSPYSGNITIPERVSYNGKSYVVSMIDQYAFADCENLRSVNLPNTITEIRDGTFEGCTGITKIVIPNSVQRLWSRAFKDATSLSSVTIGNNVEEIHNETFAGCTSLKSITFPKNIKNIYRDALEGCTGLEEVNFECVVEIGELLRGNTLHENGGVGNIGYFYSDGTWKDKECYGTWSLKGNILTMYTTSEPVIMPSIYTVVSLTRNTVELQLN